MKTDEIEFEKELEAQLEFKRNELLTGLKNAVNYKYFQAFNMSYESQRIWQIFEEISGMVDKEFKMGSPNLHMARGRKQTAKDKAVENLVNKFKIRGTKNSISDINFIVKEIEKAQEY